MRRLRAASGNAKQVVDGLRQRAETWTDGDPQRDDITRMVIERT